MLYTVMAVTKKDNSARLKKKILDLKDDLSKVKRENKFLKESIKNIKAPKSDSLFGKAKKAFKGASTGQKIISGLLGSAAGAGTIALLAGLAKAQLAKRNAEQNQPGTLDNPLQMVPVNNLSSPNNSGVNLS
jgi:hypothetical protein